MSSGFRFSVSVTTEAAMVLYRQLEMKSIEASANQEFRAARSAENLSLNRWHNVLPFDASRVRLIPPFQAKGFTTDYINASLVNVNEADRCYILTQGPLKETVWHFWTMVYQVCAGCISAFKSIILITDLSPKCHLDSELSKKSVRPINFRFD